MMNEQSKKNVDDGFDLLFAAGCMITAPYAAAMHLRRSAYRRGLLRSVSVDAPVICVGNITTGGTGKTPMVAWVVRRVQEAGRTAAVLTRGYKSVAGRSDEAELLRKLTGVDVIVQPDRIAGAKKAITAGANVLVMDDGFQHLRLRRDLDIVLIDAFRRPFGGGCCLPVGRLREPPWVLSDADAIVITRSDLVSADCLENIRRRLRALAPQASLHTAVHKPLSFIDEDGKERPISDVAGKKVFSFCGLGNPQAFFETVRTLGANTVGQKTLPDHVQYTPNLVKQLHRVAEQRKAEILLTTQKDAVKLTDAEFPRPLWQLAVRIEITSGREELLEKIHKALNITNEPRR